MASDLVVHATRPLTVECARERLGGEVTPLSRMFVRQNLDLPDPGICADRDAWTVEVSDRALTLAELKRLPTVTRRAVLECAGNARTTQPGDFGDETAWGVGAVACVDWTGVALRTLVAAPPGRWCTATGADRAGREADRAPDRVERSVPAGKALVDALLAWECNGEPIPLAHGGPLRFVVPGYYAVNSVKFVRRVAFSDAESDADIQRVRYRYRPVGADPSPAHPTLGPLRPKSLIVAPGPPEVVGVAWSGHPVTRVEVSADGGGSWRDAELGPAGDPAAWRVFRLPLRLAPGRHLLASRATDAAGEVQPERSEPNACGYGVNGWRGLALEVGR